MIASLVGKVVRLSAGELVLEVGGVGYLIHSTPKTLRGLELGMEVRLHTSQIFREDQVSLFGFLDTHEQEVFDLLRSVNGVGPKSALAILSLLTVSQISKAVLDDTDEVFKAVPGIGAKTSKLICLTLSGKLSHRGDDSVNSGTDGALKALVSLGWSDREARGALAQVDGTGLSQQELLKAALQSLAKTRSKK